MRLRVFALRQRRGATLSAILLAAVALLPIVDAHGEEQHLDDQLVDNGERLLLGRFTAPQKGALVVVPHLDGDLGCVPPASAAYRIPLETDVSGAALDAPTDAGVSFAANDTHFAAYFDAPSRPAGSGSYAALAIDTHDATRTLILMEENAVAIHALVGIVAREDGLEARTGALGLPYPIPDTAAHDMGEFEPEGGGVLMTHDDSFSGATACAADQAGHFAALVENDALPDSLGAGRLVHIVAMLDPGLDGFPPRPLDERTAVLQANLYLARHGEDPARVREALDPRAGVPDVLPLVALAAGLVLVARRP